MKVCQVSSVLTTFETRIFYKVCLSLSKRYDVYYVSANAKTEDVEGVHVNRCRTSHISFVKVAETWQSLS